MPKIEVKVESASEACRGSDWVLNPTTPHPRDGSIDFPVTELPPL